MQYVRSQSTYEEFISGRDVSSALHREDGTPGYCIGMVDVPRDGDDVITEQQYESGKSELQSYNAALPISPAPPPVDPAAALVAAIKAAPDLEALKVALTGSAADIAALQSLLT